MCVWCVCVGGGGGEGREMSKFIGGVRRKKEWR